MTTAALRGAADSRFEVFGPGEVLQLIRSGRAQTRGEVQEATGLSRLTVAQRIDYLLSTGLIREAGAGQATGGRRANAFEFDVQHSVILCGALETRHAHVAIVKLDGAIIAEQWVDVAVADGPDAALARLLSAFSELLAQTGTDHSLVGGVALSIPGPVDPHSKRPSQPPIMPGWDAFPISDVVQDVFPVPVFVENDADAMAYGEQARNWSDNPALCLVKISTGIGAGIIINGAIYHGIDGGAGDIGHIRLADVDDICQCGSVGCLAAVASGGALARQLRAVGVAAQSGSDVRDLVAEGNLDALRLTHEAGIRIGDVLAGLVSTLNPGLVLIGGDLACTPMVGGIREGLYPRSLPRATRNLQIQLSTMGPNAGLIGLTHVAVDDLYSAAAINQHYAANR